MYPEGSDSCLVAHTESSGCRRNPVESKKLCSHSRTRRTTGEPAGRNDTSDSGCLRLHIGECREGARICHWISEPLRKWPRMKGERKKPSVQTCPALQKGEKLTSTFSPSHNPVTHESFWSPCGGRWYFLTKVVINPPPIFSFSLLHLPDP